MVAADIRKHSKPTWAAVIHLESFSAVRLDQCLCEEL